MFRLYLTPDLLKLNTFLSNLNFGKISRKTAIAGKRIYLDSLTIAKMFGVVSCLITVVDPKLSHSK